MYLTNRFTLILVVIGFTAIFVVPCFCYPFLSTSICNDIAITGAGIAGICFLVGLIYNLWE